MKELDPRAPWLADISQYQVDFVIPRLGVDLPLAIDPFLLFKSRDTQYQHLHKLLLDVFNSGIQAIRQANLPEARRILNFPEVSAIGLGYTRKGKRGAGVGSYLTNLIIDTLGNSPDLRERGVRHVEEMQLFSAGIGPDRVSDIVANVLKQFLIEYTQRQSQIWSLPIQAGVPVTQVFNHSTGEWQDFYEDLPVSPLDGYPILLVPRRLVRAHP